MAEGVFRQAEVAFFRSLNAWAEPLARSGALSPGVLPAGLVLVEVRGRSSGIAHPVPLVATRLGEAILVSTARGSRSQWVRNLIANPGVRYWLHGRARDGRAVVVAPGSPAPDVRDETLVVRGLVSQLYPWTMAGWAFAVILPLPGD